MDALLNCAQAAQTEAGGPPNGHTMVEATFDSGRLIRGRGDQWLELGENGTEFNFREYDATEERVYLHDESRDVRLMIDLNSWTILYSGPGEDFRPLYQISAVE